MVQILDENRRKSLGEMFGQAFANVGDQAGQGIGQYLMGDQARKKAAAQQQETADMLSKLTGQQFTGREDPELLKALSTQLLKNQGKDSLWEKKQGFFGQLFGGGTGSPEQQGFQEQDPTRQMMENPMGMGQQQQQGGFDPSTLTDSQIAQATLADPNLGRMLQQQKEAAYNKNIKNLERDRDIHESDRTYHTQFSKPEEEKVNQLRETLPKKEMALNFARDAVENGDMSYFSKDKLADATGVDLFRTAKGAQLNAAGKENLISNLSKVSAKAQNQWLEQRMNSVFPKIGQSLEANLTVQEMIEAETAMDKAYINEFERLSDQDQAEYGFVRKDISKRAHDAVKSKNNDIMRRSAYRIKEIEEREKGSSKLKQQVGKNVVKGTPLTMQMAKQYKDKFGANALKVAEKNGYYIPSVEEFRLYQMRPMEYGEANNI